MEGKIITCCGDCVHYDWKKHKCRNGYNDDKNPRKHFYQDCKTLEDLESHDAKVRADVIDEIIAKIDDEYFDGGYGDYHEVAMIVRMLEELKEQKND